MKRIISIDKESMLTRAQRDEALQCLDRLDEIVLSMPTMPRQKAQPLIRKLDKLVRDYTGAGT